MRARLGGGEQGQAKAWWGFQGPLNICHTGGCCVADEKGWPKVLVSKDSMAVGRGEEPFFTGNSQSAKRPEKCLSFLSSFLQWPTLILKLFLFSKASSNRRLLSFVHHR